MAAALTRGVVAELLTIALTRSREDTLATALTEADDKLLTVALTQSDPELLATALEVQGLLNIFLCIVMLNIFPAGSRNCHPRRGPHQVQARPAGGGAAGRYQGESQGRPHICKEEIKKYRKVCVRF